MVPCPLTNPPSGNPAASDGEKDPPAEGGYSDPLVGVAGVALVFLGGQTPVLTRQINNPVSRFSGMHLLIAAVSISMLAPTITLFATQRFCS